MRIGRTKQLKTAFGVGSLWEWRQTCFSIMLATISIVRSVRSSLCHHTPYTPYHTYHTIPYTNVLHQTQIRGAATFSILTCVTRLQLQLLYQCNWKQQLSYDGAYQPPQDTDDLICNTTPGECWQFQPLGWAFNQLYVPLQKCLKRMSSQGGKQFESSFTVVQRWLEWQQQNGAISTLAWLRVSNRPQVLRQ